MVPNSSSEIMVTCRCGAEIRVANPYLVAGITCSICGCKVDMDKASKHPADDHDHSALMSAALHGDPKHRHKMATRFVREGKYDEAIDLYKSIMAEDAVHRDAYYGLGFCYYKLGQLPESQTMLRMAADMGHPAAKGLLTKATVKLAGQKAGGMV